MGTINAKGDGSNNNITISKGDSAPPRKLNTLTGETDRSFAQPNKTSATPEIEAKVHASVVDEERAIRENSQKEKEQADLREIEAKRARTAKTRQEEAEATAKVAAEEAARKEVEVKKAAEGSRRKTTGELPEDAEVEAFDYTKKTNVDAGDNDSTND